MHQDSNNFAHFIEKSKMRRLFGVFILAAHISNFAGNDIPNIKKATCQRKFELNNDMRKCKIEDLFKKQYEGEEYESTRSSESFNCHDVEEPLHYYINPMIQDNFLLGETIFTYSKSDIDL